MTKSVEATKESLENLLNVGYTIQQIADYFLIYKSTVRYLLKQYGLKANRGRPKKKGKD